MRVTGVVQGVGFRPFVYNLAVRLGLSGWVCNDPEGVLIEAQGPRRAVDAFLSGLREEAPPAALLESITVEALPLGEDGAFRIRESATGAPPTARVSVDLATCPDCLREVFDPADRRAGYPFTNCTNCGPRFTIITGIPYDRPNTTMAGFRMCPECRREYEDPSDRRFHAQPNACPLCGPRVYLFSGEGRPLSCGDPVREAARALVGGKIVAVKGLGGFHLACDATSEAAVARLRARKCREAKPLAVMVATLEDARRYGRPTPQEERLLACTAAPIVLVRRGEAPLAPSVAPGFERVGLFLAYTPLHHLLLAAAGRPLVMTSGNRTEEPICYEETDALERLRGIADLVLSHDRPIRTRCDDSVARVVLGAPQMLRRSRGYVPSALRLPLEAAEPILATGAHLKNTFALVRGRDVFLSHHIGDLENPRAVAAFEDAVEHLGRLLEINPRIVAADMHPDAWPVRYAQSTGLPIERVQHHHAHVASCMAEHGLAEPVLGVAYDGLGYGEDGTLWGGELLLCRPGGFERLGHLRAVPAPGGERAFREPWRMALAHLDVSLGERAFDLDLPLWRVCDRERAGAVLEATRAGVNAPLTTAVGRLFDAMSALLGLRAVSTYEGEAACALEELAKTAAGAAPLPFEVDVGERIVIDASTCIATVAEALARGADAAALAAGFHEGLALATARAVKAACERCGVGAVCLTGGVFQNEILTLRCCEHLEAAGLRPLLNRAVPPNDGGVSLGQAYVAAARSA